MIIRIKLFFVILISVLVILLLLFYCSLQEVPTIYNLTVSTERISYNKLKEGGSRFILNDATVYNEDSIALQHFDGSIEIPKGTKVIIERIGLGPINITLSNIKKSAGVFYNKLEHKIRYKGSEFLEISISNSLGLSKLGINTNLPIFGKAEIGRQYDYEIWGESTALLRNGKISISAKSSLTDDLYDAGEINLSLGDYVVFEGQQNDGFGFASINETPGMTVSYNVNAERAKIFRPGAKPDIEGYSVAATYLDEFIKDRLFQSLSIMFGVLLIVTTLGTFIFDSLSYLKPNK